MKIKNLLLFPLGIFFAIHVSAQPVYNYYFGNLHSQSSYSDGNKDSSTSLITTPLQDFNYAKTSQHIDFYGICDHNHSNAGMTSPAYYHRGLADANAANQDGTFVALYGMEWGVISGGGHVIVYGYDSLMGWDASDYDVFVAQHNYTSLWQKINAKQGAFAYLAHPSSSDYNNLFTSAYSAEADSAIVGMAARSGPAFSTNTSYSDPASGTFITRYQDALKRGYHMGVGLDHDTHNSNFGRQSAGRLVVLATSLTRANVMDAMKKMRFYSSDDWNVKVDFSISSQPMGSIITHAGNPVISVTVTDPDGEGVSSIKVYSGVPGSGTAATVLTSNTGATSLSYTHTIANNSQYYYYLMITQTDGNVIWTSPIWYKRDDAASSIPVAAFTTSAAGTCVGQPLTLIDNSSNAPTSWSWSMPGGTPSASSLQSPVVTYSTAGTHTVTLVASNASGTSATATGSVMVNTYPVVSATGGSACNGQPAVVGASGAGMYSWNNGATGASITVHPTGPTTYIVTGTTSGCSATATASVTVNPSPPGPVITVAGDTLTSSSATGNQWYFNGGPVSGAVNQQYIVYAAGTYSVVVTNSFGCSSVSPQVNPTVISVADLSENKNIHVFPNPVSTSVNISFADNKEPFNIELFSSTGQLMVTEKVSDCTKDCLRTIDMSGFSKGIYLVKIYGTNSVFTKKVVLMK